MPSKFRCDSFNILGVMRWGPNQPPSVPEDQVKPGLNRINLSDIFGQSLIA